MTGLNCIHIILDQKQLKLSISGVTTYFFNASFGNVEKWQEEFEFDEGVESAEAVFDWVELVQRVLGHDRGAERPEVGRGAELVV